MACDIRFIVLNADETFGTELRGTLLHFEGVKIIAEVDEPALLHQAVKQFPVDVLLANLDPNPEAVLHIVGEVASSEPALSVFATSESTEGQLILRAMRLGVREFLPRPIDARTLEEAIEKVAAQRIDAKAEGKLITVTGSSGGAGATMLATNLAVELAAIADGPVTVVDLDYRFGQVATLLDVDPRFTLADLCASPEQLEQQVTARALVQHDSGVRVLSRPPTFAQADTMTAASCVGLLSSLLQINQYVVADGPGRFDVHARSVFDISDVSFLVVQLLVPSVRNALRIIEGLRESGYNLGRSRLVCNRASGDGGQLSVKDVGETLSMQAFACIPDDWATVSGAVNLGEPLAQHSPKSKVRLAIQKIAQRLHATYPEADEEDTRRKGLIGRMFAAS
jgi:pilus assembly protein CpaE